MKLSKTTALIFACHSFVSFMFLLGVAGSQMRAAYNVPAPISKVLPYVLSFHRADILVTILCLAALTGILTVQVLFLNRRLPFNIMGISTLLLLGSFASALNSNSTQGPFSFVPDGFSTTCRMLSGSLMENAWSADTWVPQASMMWWTLLWAGLIVSRNMQWMITMHLEPISGSQ